MTTDLLRLPAPELDYYLVLSPGARPRTEGILVEEFVLDADHTAAGLRSGAWTSGDRTWWDASGASRTLRADRHPPARAVPRADAERTYRELGGGTLPDGAALRALCTGYRSLAGSAPLRLIEVPPADGFHEARLYRLLLAGDLDPDALAALRDAWREPSGTAAGTRRIGDDRFDWELRVIGDRIAWAVDVTVQLGVATSDTIGPLLHELRSTMRGHGLIPVTIERFR